MKKVKISFSGYGDSFFGFPLDDNFLIEVLKERYELEITSPEKADFVFCGIWGEPYEYCSVEAVRIMLQGENYIPDFNLIDYSVCPYPIKFFDRNYYVPCGVEALLIHNYRHCLELKNRNGGGYGLSFLTGKKYFANFLAGHDSEFHYRSEFFKKLSEYRRVEAAGWLYNNMPNGYRVDWRDETKIGFQALCKFTICFESTKHEGFVTEKIVDAFLAGTIPIYYGSSTVHKIFNSKAFIDISDYKNFDEAIERIKAIDKDDNLFLSIINEPVFAKGFLPEDVVYGFKQYMYHILDQSPQDAYRRSRVYSPSNFDSFCSFASQYGKKWREMHNKMNDHSLSVKEKCKKISRKVVGNRIYEHTKKWLRGL